VEIRKSTTIDVPLEKLWEIVAHGFADVGLWASSVHHSRANDRAASPDGAEIGGRVCTTAFGDLDENLTHYDAENHTLGYRAEGTPSFMTHAENRWSLQPLGPSRTEIRMHVTMGFNAFPGQLMKLFTRVRASQAVSEALEELKLYAETSRLHPRKVRAQQRVAAKVRRAVAP
jgi:hypothetical protein